MTETVSSWHRRLLERFTPQMASVAPVTILIDPDGLYEDPALLASIEKAGFAILRFDDPLRFRVTYEREYRERWDRGEKTRPLVIHSTLPGDQLPYDLVEEVALADHIITVKLADFFDRLDPNMVLSLDRDLLGRLYERYQEKPPLHGGENATADYLLTELFGLRPDQWQTDSSLLAALMAYHYEGRKLPACLVDRLVSRLSTRFPEWPLQRLWTDRELFFAFVGERWGRYVYQVTAAARGEARDATAPYLVEGPADLPFGEKEVRVYLDTLFLEGLVSPVKDIDPSTLPAEAEWMQLGIAPVTEEDQLRRFRRQTEQLQQELPSGFTTHRQWLAYGRKLGEWLSSRWSLSLPQEDEAAAQALHSEAERRFTAWLVEHFSALLSLPPIPQPWVVHQVAPHMAWGWAANGRPKRALVVVDGMNWAQWSVLRRQLNLGPNVEFQEHSTLAFLPSITQVSRQAIFAGDLPRSFAASISTNSQEAALWTRFWESQGAMKPQVGYLLYGEGESVDHFLTRLAVLTSKAPMRVIGLVLGQVDRLTHGAAGVVSSRELQKHVAAWGESGTLELVLTHLLDAGYEIFLTADHGNVEAVGVGNPQTGSLTEERSERALVFRHPALRDSVAEKFPNAVPWEGAGLPDDWNALLATGFEAFTTPGKLTLSHGGISIEEMVVPFVRMRQRYD